MNISILSITESAIYLRHKHAINAVELVLQTIYTKIEIVECEAGDISAYVLYRCTHPLTGNLVDVLVRIDKDSGVPKIFKNLTNTPS